MPQYKDYLIVLNPSNRVKNSISHCKQRAGEFIGSYAGLNSIAHISLWHKQNLSPELIDVFTSILQRKISNVPSTTITIDGFDYFVHGNNLMTIYASVKSNYITDTWFKQVREQFNLKSNDFIPHLTVTKTIHVDAFFSLWPKFNSSSFRMSFVPASISVLERNSGTPGAKWQVRKEIYFENIYQF